MKSLTRTLNGPADFELGIPRSRKLSYTISSPDEGQARGLVFVIPGFGGDTAKGYGESLRRHIVETHGFSAVSVDYHCIEARPENGGAVGITPREHFMLIGLAAHNNLKVSSYENLTELTSKLASLKTPIEAFADIAPGGGEYQNFGVLQAMDHVAVLADIVARGPEFDRAHVIALGSSHGGYIAHMIAKIAPSSLSAVMDNSAYTQAPPNFMGMGVRGEYRTRMGGVTLVCRVKSGWTIEGRDLPNFYDRNADLIRDVAYPPHIEAMKAGGTGGPAFLMVNAAQDGISLPELKLRQAAALKRAGFGATIDIIGKSQIDGRVFKEMTHGLNASLKGLFDRLLPHIVPREGLLDCEAGTVVDYPCVDKGYRFSHDAAGVSGATYDLFPLDDAQAA